MSFKVGDRVAIIGHRGHVDYTGYVGTVIDFRAQRLGPGMFNVQLDRHPSPYPSPRDTWFRSVDLRHLDVIERIGEIAQ